jgi:hypothetical protein
MKNVSLIFMSWLCIASCLVPSLNASANLSFTSPYPKTFAPKAGTLSLGARNTMNVFFESPDMIGQGAGGCFRIQIGERLNTEWFADYVSSKLYQRAERIDKHIGWNVMYYLLDTKSFQRPFTPFLAAGHCFDYTGIRLNGADQPTVGKWTSAVQMSFGTHFNINPRFDITLSSLYDLHLGREVEVELTPENKVEIESHRNAGWEGHVMLILSVNYKIAQLWTSGKQLK